MALRRRVVTALRPPRRDRRRPLRAEPGLFALAGVGGRSSRCSNCMFMKACIGAAGTAWFWLPVLGRVPLCAPDVWTGLMRAPRPKKINQSWESNAHATDAPSPFTRCREHFREWRIAASIQPASGTRISESGPCHACTIPYHASPLLLTPPGSPGCQRCTGGEVGAVVRMHMATCACMHARVGRLCDGEM